MTPRALFRFFSSIRLTVTLLGLSIVLIFFGTLDQVEFGVYHTQQRYFESFVAVWQYPATWVGGQGALSWLALPMPGGYVLGPMLVVNLLCAHFRYFRPRWSKAGIVLIHGGVVMLLLGQLATQVGQEEYFMWLDEGGAGNYIESSQHSELVVADITEPGHRIETVVPMDLFDDRPTWFEPEGLPLRLEVIGYLRNAGIALRKDLNFDMGPMLYDRGIGAESDLVVWKRDPTYKQNERNVAAAVVRVHGADGRALGAWLVSDSFRNRRGDGVWVDAYEPQTLEYGGRRYEVALRFKREYLPARIELVDFTHEVYPGTQIPRNFSSKVRTVDEASGTSRQTLVYMNHPLRFAGYTFYQASFAQGDTASMFQVVRNPARWFPYVSSSIISAGLVVQFLISLIKFARRKGGQGDPPKATKVHAVAVEGGAR